MKNEKFITLLAIITFFLFLPKPILAESSYVLPYPPQMPGSFMYKLRVISESIQRYWYFGNFGQFEYNLKMADKYLVQAKTLFEYKQYLLGYKALRKSDSYFVNIIPNLLIAEKAGKNILQKKAIFAEASLKHAEIIQEIIGKVPSTFIWMPEKLTPTVLSLEKTLNESIRLREKTL